MLKTAAFSVALRTRAEGLGFCDTAVFGCFGDRLLFGGQIDTPAAGWKLLRLRHLDNAVLFALPHLLLAAPRAERGVVGDFALTGLAFR